MSAFAFLFSELVQYSQAKVKNVNELEKRLEDAGYGVGMRLLELLIHREKANKREVCAVRSYQYKSCYSHYYRMKELNALHVFLVYMVIFC